jgi:hypothetical protein
MLDPQFRERTKEMLEDVEKDLHELKGKRLRQKVNNWEQWTTVMKKAKVIWRP